MALTKEQFLARRPVSVHREQVPAMGGEVCLRGLTGDRRDYWDLFQVANRDDETKRLRTDTRHFRSTLVALALCDERGTFWFDPYADSWPVEVEAIGEEDGAIIDRLFDVAEDISGLSPVKREALRKNSETARNGDSGCSSPEPSTVAE